MRIMDRKRLKQKGCEHYFNMPNFNMPDFSMPDFNMPDFSMPKSAGVGPIAAPVYEQRVARQRLRHAS
jgi:hypothetical protein